NATLRPAVRLTYKKRSRRLFLHKLLLLPQPEDERCEEKQRLLNSCGLRVKAGTYMLLLRLSVLLSGLMIVLTLAQGYYWPGMLGSSERMLLLIVSAGIWIATAADKPILERVRHMRRYRIIRDIDVLSRQLLYYSGLSGNMHGKLLRCLPFAGSLRS